MKKRYWVFLFDDYYPYGGMGDFAKDYETLEEVKISVEYTLKKTFHYCRYDEKFQLSGVYNNVEIYDSRDDKILKDEELK